MEKDGSFVGFGKKYQDFYIEATKHLVLWCFIEQYS